MIDHGAEILDKDGKHPVLHGGEALTYTMQYTYEDGELLGVKQVGYAEVVKNPRVRHRAFRFYYDAQGQLSDIVYLGTQGEYVLCATCVIVFNAHEPLFCTPCAKAVARMNGSEYPRQ